MSHVRAAVTTALAVISISAVSIAHAQNYPTRAIRFIIPQSAGSATDTVARMIGTRLADKFGQPVVHENRAGAGGVIGAEITVKAPPDGYTMLIVSATHTVNPSLRKSLPYDTIADFAPITLATAQPYVMLAHPSLPAKNVKELVALARAHPGQVNYASSGAGTLGHLGFEQLNTMGKVKMVHVPYKGAAPAVVDLISGHVQLSFISAPGAMPHVQEKRLRVLAVTNSKRSLLLPEIPTISEAGLKGYESEGWHGLFTPTGTPKPAIDRLYKEISTLLRDPKINSVLAAGGAEPVGIPPEEFGRKLNLEIEKWAKVVKSSGMKVD